MSRFGKSGWWPGESPSICLHREGWVHGTKKLWWLTLRVNLIGSLSPLDVRKAYLGVLMSTRRESSN